MKTWKIIILLSYISVASASAAIITPALPIIQNAFHINHGDIEWVMSIFLLGYVLGQIIYGPLSNRFGRLSALRIGLTINLIGIIICIISTMSYNFHLLLVGRFITALGASSGLACTFMLLNESVSAGRVKHALSFAAVSFTAGIGGAVLIGGLITEYLNWSYCFWFLLVHGIIMISMTRLFSETLVSRVKVSLSDITKSYITAFTYKKLLVYSLSLGSVAVFTYCYSSAAPFIVHSLFKISALSYGYWNILNMFGMLSGAIVSSIIIKRYPSKNILISSVCGVILMSLILAILTISNMLNVLLFFIITTFIYFICSFIFPTASHIASNAIDCKANASGAMNFINMGVAALSVILLGYLPFSPLWGFIMILSLFSMFCLVLLLIVKD